MIELYIRLEPHAGKEAELEAAFRGLFEPAISAQQGFRSVALLKARDALREYGIRLAFDSEELRLKWVASSQHQEAFPRIAALCQQVSWTGFDVVSRRLKE